MNVSEHRSYPLLLKLSLATALLAGMTCTQTGTAQAAEKKSNKVQLGTDELTLGVPGKGPLTKAEIKEWLDNPENHQILEVTLPLGLSAGQAQMQGLKENPLTRAKVELGRQLYFDKRLSSDNTISCASCHHPDEGWGRHTQFGIGVRDQEGGRNSPISYNRILSGPQFWDGRAATLEEQAVGPIANPIEMANTHENAVKTLKKIPGYQMQFKKIFKDGITIDNVGKAIAAFERSVVTGPTPFDYQEQLKPFLKLDKEDLEDFKEEYEAALAMTKKHPMSDSAKRGMKLFFSEEVNCAACHLGPNLADEKYHNLGVGMDADKPDLGRYEVTKQEKDKGAFKTPTIRNVEQSAPYMHDGSLETLEEVVEHYNKGGTPNPWLSDKVKKLNLSAQDKKDLVAFMKACTGSFPKVEPGRLPE
ncbi:cytochrome-c peroxidase [Gimesia chilikensis]|uniref:cytochrome-c peroxidase n=1 Tax=Gimesia chilikensis TaxID=2605989 RepID=UPI003A902578